MRTVRSVGVYAFVGVVAIAAIEVRSNESGGGGGEKPPTYHVNVIEWATAEYYGNDLNEHGQASLTGPSPVEQFGLIGRRWDERGGFLAVGPDSSMTTGINNRGDVTVVMMGAYASSTPWRAGLWTARDGLTELGTLGGLRTFADAVNDRGEVVGWSEDAAGDRYAFLWTKEQGMRSLEDLPGGSANGWGIDITNNGMVVGTSYGADGQFGFRWTEKGGMQSLGDLPGGRAESAAKAANERGQIVGVGHIEANYSRAVLWDEEGRMRDLGVLRPGDISHADDINKDGVVVGWSAPYPGGTSLAFVPFVWTEEHGMLDLHTLLDEASAEWQLAGFQMGGINDRGQILLSGMLDGQYARVLLTPINPEPATLLTCVSGALLLLRRQGVRRARS